jgi:hypothetical protein
MIPPTRMRGSKPWQLEKTLRYVLIDSDRNGIIDSWNHNIGKDNARKEAKRYYLRYGAGRHYCYAREIINQFRNKHFFRGLYRITVQSDGYFRIDPYSRIIPNPEHRITLHSHQEG